MAFLIQLCFHECKSESSQLLCEVVRATVCALNRVRQRDPFGGVLSSQQAKILFGFAC